MMETNELRSSLREIADSISAVRVALGGLIMGKSGKLNRYAITYRSEPDHWSSDITVEQSACDARDAAEIVMMNVEATAGSDINGRKMRSYLVRVAPMEPEP